MKTLLTIAAILSATTAFAQTMPVLDLRQERQAERIEQGIESGELNEREAARMERQQARTEKMEDKAKADGVVTKKERAHLQHRENKTSRHIAHQKHDGHKAH